MLKSIFKTLRVYLPLSIIIAYHLRPYLGNILAISLHDCCSQIYWNQWKNDEL